MGALFLVASDGDQLRFFQSLYEEGEMEDTAQMIANQVILQVMAENTKRESWYGWEVAVWANGKRLMVVPFPATYSSWPMLPKLQNDFLVSMNDINRFVEETKGKKRSGNLSSLKSSEGDDSAST